MRLTWPGANRKAFVEPLDRLPGVSNYLIGGDPGAWRTQVPTYARIAVRELYPGVDLVFYGNERQLEYDIIARPSADLKTVRMRFAGAKAIRTDRNGDLIVRGSQSEIRQPKPFVYQRINGQRRRVEARYRVNRSQEIGFDFGKYDSTQPLVIDPVIVFSTYLGGNLDDQILGVAVDGFGNLYVTGQTSSSDFPFVGGAYQYASQFDVFVTKIGATGTDVYYSTFVGGAKRELGQSIAVDASGRACVTGITEGDFPTVNAIQPNYGGGAFDGFVFKLNLQGDGLVYSTYLGGPGTDGGHGIAVDASGNAYVTGQASVGFPLVNPLQVNYGGGSFDAFVAKIDPTGSALVYSTFLGGSGADQGDSIAIDSSGNAFVAGLTSGSFTLQNAYQQNYGGGSFDAFVTKINPQGSALVYSTYLGGGGYDEATGIAVDGAGNAYLTGITGGEFPLANPLQPTFGGVYYDAFLTKINPQGNALVYSTYLGAGLPGSFASYFGYGIALDAAANAYVAGYLSYGPPFSSGVATATKVDPQGSSVLYSVNLGDTNTAGLAIAVGGNGTAYLGGWTGSRNLYTFSRLQGYSNRVDGFLAAISSNDSGCAFSFFPQNILSDSGGGSGGLILSGLANCAWLARSDSSWLHPDVPMGIGPGGVGFRVDGNPTPNQRAGKISVGAATFTFTQSGTPPCEYILQQTSQTAPASGYNGQFSLITYSYCSWTATSNVSWIQLTPSSGSGGTLLFYYVAANPTAVPRTGTMTVGGLTFTVTQEKNDAAQPPAATSVTPQAGSGSNQTFRFVFTDPNGFADMPWVQMLFNSSLIGLSGCYTHYDRSSNVVLLLNDAASGWLGPVALGTASTLQNAQCTVNAQTSSASGVGTDLTVNLTLTFNPAFGGTKNIYMQTVNNGGVAAVWAQRGTWTPFSNQAPSTVSVTPATGTGSVQTFSFLYSDPNGFTDIPWVQMIVNTALNGANACYTHYDRPSNSVLLLNDAATGWLGPATVGTVNTLQNSQCLVNARASSASGVGDNLTVNLNLAFKSTFTGAKNVYTQTQDTGGLATGWQQRGAWTVNGPIAPSAASVSPNAASGLSQTFTFTFVDANGFGDIAWGQMLINGALDGSQGCYTHYDPPSNSVLLLNDAGSAWLGPMPLGAVGTLQNSQCALDLANSSASGTAQSLIVNLKFSFNSGWNGQRAIFMQTQDNGGLATGWQQRGFFTIP